MKTSPILVIGATGKTGARIVRGLTAAGHPVRAGSRGSATPFDWDRPETWRSAVEGASAVYISYFPDLLAPGAEENIRALSDLARRKGVGRLVLLSGRGEAAARRCEEIVLGSGVPATVVRCAWFAQNFSEGYLRDAAMAGTIALPAGEVREPILDVDDIADVAVAALTEDGHAGAVYELTGPRLMSFSEIAADLSAVMGRPVRYVPVSLEDFRDGMSAVAGPEVAALVEEIVSQTLDGRNEYVADGVQRALGRAPRDFRDFCRDAAGAGVWKDAA